MAEVPRIIVTTHDGSVVGDLDPARLVDMVVVDEVNGERSLTVTTTEELSKGDRLLWRDGMLKWHEYVVEADEAEHSAGEATHAYFCPWSLQCDLSRTFVSAMPGTGGTPATAWQALEAALGGTARWAVGTVEVTTTGSASFFRTSGWEALQTLVATWGGEVDATIEVGLAGVTSRSVSLLAHVGNEGATRRFDYGHDVAGIRRTVMDEPWTCRVIPLGAALETEGGGYGRKLTIEDANSGVMWLEDVEAAPLVRVPDGAGGWEYPTQIVENDRINDAEALKAWATEHLHDWTRPKVSYECSVAQLAEAGMDAQGVAVGDECAVVDAAFGETPIRIETRLLRLEHHPLDRSQDVLTFSNLVDGLGSQLGDIARSVAQVQSQVTSLSLNQSTAEYVSSLISRMNAEANATGGYTYITEGQGLRTYDRAVTDPLVGAEATQVVEVKGGTIRIANSHTSSGDWEWKTVFTSGHVAADVVTAAQITTGYIGSNGGTYINLDTGTVHLGNSEGFHAIVNANSLDFYDGGTLVASFGEDGTQIGASDQSRVKVDYHSMRLLDREGDEYFVASDLRDESGLAAIVDTFTGDGTTKRFVLSRPMAVPTSATVSDGSGGSKTWQRNTITFSDAPTDGSTITVEYKTASNLVKEYTLGTRGNGSIGAMSVVAGISCVASSLASHAEGDSTTASGLVSHAEGDGTTASGSYSHAEGGNTTASENYSHAEGSGTTASGLVSHAEGDNTTASGFMSHAEGTHTTASGLHSHAQNAYTIAASDNQTAMGLYNVEDSAGKYALIIGNGNAALRSNALTVDWSGNAETAGSHVIKDAKFDRDGSNPQQTTYSSAFAIQDKDAELMGRLRVEQYYDGRTGCYMQAFAEGDDGTVHGNYIEVLVDKSGNKSYLVDAPAAFRDAIGATGGVWQASSLVSTGWTYLEGSSTSSFYVRWAKVAGIVFVEAFGQKAMAAGASVQLATDALPSGSRPSKEVDAMVNVSTNNVAGMWVNTSGAIYARNYGASATTNIYGCVSFPAI